MKISSDHRCRLGAGITGLDQEFDLLPPDGSPDLPHLAWLGTFFIGLTITNFKLTRVKKVDRLTKKL